MQHQQQQQQQQQKAMLNMMPSFPPTNITTEQIQKRLDENKKLILAILDNQNLGKLAECAQYQAQLQQNLMYLAAIADAQPQAPATPSQVPTHGAMHQGGHYMQHPQAASMGQQPSGFPSKMMPMQFNPQQMQDQQQLQHQHQQAVQGHLGMRGGVSNGMHNEANIGGGSSVGPSQTCVMADFSRSGAGAGAGAGAIASNGGGACSNPMDGRGGKQDGTEAGSGEVKETAAAGNITANGEHAYMKGSETA